VRVLRWHNGEVSVVAKSELTIDLEKQIWKHTKRTGVFGCFEVTIGWYGKERVDFMTYDTKGTFRCYEIKVSKADFNSNAKVSFLGHYNYYVMPEKLYGEVEEEIPRHVGVFVSKGRKLVSVKNAKKQELHTDEQILKDSMIRSLYRESERVISSNDQTAVERLRKQVARAEYRADKNYREYRDLQRRVIGKYGYDAYRNL
jgi:hypothetical protein